MQKNLVFDFGNVLIDLDFRRTTDQLIHWLGEDYRTKIPDQVFTDFEVGKITEAEFFNALRATAQYPVSILQLKEAWNGMLLEIPSARLEMLERLRKDHAIYLLSNTNITHINYVHGYLDAVHGIKDFETRFFDKAYYSHEINLRKPNSDIYEFLLKDAGLKPHETLFIDDIAENIEAAKRLGIQTHLHPVGAEITHLFKHVTV